MSILNRIVIILVFLAAVAAGVLGYVLFEKRNDVKASHDVMAQSIVDGVNQLNKDTGKKTKITAGDLAINVPVENVKEKLAILKTAVKNTVEQRRKLAEGLAEIAKINELENADELSAEKLLNSGSCEGTIDKIISSVKEKVDNEKSTRAQLLATILTVCKTCGLEPDEAKINAADIEYIKANLDKIAATYNEYGALQKKFQDYIAKINAELKIDAGDLNPDEAIDKQISAIKKLNKDIAEANVEIERLKKLIGGNGPITDDGKGPTQAQVDKLNAEIAVLNDDVKNAKKEIASQKKENSKLADQIKTQATTISELTAENNRLRKLINPPPEVYRPYEGVVKEVYAKEGFVVIQITKGKEGDILAFPKNAFMTTASSLKADAVLTGRIQYDNKRFSTDMLYACILEVPGKKIPRVGDIVYFTEKDVEDTEAYNANVKAKEADAQAAKDAAKVATPAPKAEAPKTEDEKAPAKDESTETSDSEKSVDELIQSKTEDDSVI